MTLREFRCVECCRATYIEHSDCPGGLKELRQKSMNMYCAFCGDDLEFVEDHNLTIVKEA